MREHARSIHNKVLDAGLPQHKVTFSVVDRSTGEKIYRSPTALCIIRNARIFLFNARYKSYLLTHFSMLMNGV